MVSQKENNCFPETKLKVLEHCKKTDTTFKISVMRKISELKENLEMQFSDLRNKINEKKEYFTKEIKTLEKNQAEILELQNSITEVLENIGNREDHMEERLSELKERNLERIQVENERENLKKQRNSVRTIQPH